MRKKHIEPKVNVVEVVGVEVRNGTKKKSSLSRYEIDKENKETLVLYIHDGVMNTKVFDGAWTLEQISRWTRAEEASNE